MLQVQETTSMILPATKGKSNGAIPTSNLYSQANTSRARRVKAWFEERIQRARKEGVFMEVVDLDPVLAELLLSYNADNRPIRPIVLSRFETDMQNGQWAMNGESLKVSLDGLLNDGQHRCHSVINTGTTIKTLIMFGLPRISRMTLDQGGNRMAGDYLGMSGAKDANHCAAVAAMIWMVTKHGSILAGGANRPTRQQVQEVYHQHPQEIAASIKAVPSRGSKLVGGLSILAFSHFMFSLKDKAAADVFIQKLVNGDDLKRNDPIYVVRRRLMETADLRPSAKCELIWHAWNAARAGRQMTASKVMGRLPPLSR
jgi:hypothetical protein